MPSWIGSIPLSVAGELALKADVTSSYARHSGRLVERFSMRTASLGQCSSSGAKGATKEASPLPAVPTELVAKTW